MIMLDNLDLCYASKSWSIYSTLKSACMKDLRTMAATPQTSLPIKRSDATTPNPKAEELETTLQGQACVQLLMEQSAVEGSRTGERRASWSRTAKHEKPRICKRTSIRLCLNLTLSRVRCQKEKLPSRIMQIYVVRFQDGLEMEARTVLGTREGDFLLVCLQGKKAQNQNKMEHRRDYAQRLQRSVEIA